MCIIEVFCALCRSEKACCCCLKIGNKTPVLIHLLDILEAGLCATLAYFYWTRVRETITYVPWVLLLFGNFLPIVLRLFGASLRACGALRLWTRQAVFCARLWALLFQLTVLVGQGLATYFLLQDRIESVSEFPLIGTYLETPGTIDNDSADSNLVTKIDNYDKLGYGFCVFCDPGDGKCQSGFEAYQRGEP